MRSITSAEDRPDSSNVRVAPHTSRVVLAGSARLGVAAGFPRETVDKDANGAKDSARVKAMAGEIRRLAAAK